jgi:hypothetical protein
MPEDDGNKNDDKPRSLRDASRFSYLWSSRLFVLSAFHAGKRTPERKKIVPAKVARTMEMEENPLKASGFDGTPCSENRRNAGMNDSVAGGLEL